MSVDRQTQALLALVEADRARKCDAILDEARARAAALRAEAVVWSACVSAAALRAWIFW